MNSIRPHMPPMPPDPRGPVLAYAGNAETPPDRAGRSTSRAVAFWGGTAVGTFALLAFLSFYFNWDRPDRLEEYEFWSMIGASAAFGVILGGIGGIFVESRLSRYCFSQDRIVRRGSLLWAFVAGAGYFTIPTITIMAMVMFMTVHVPPLLVLGISLVWLVGYPEGTAFLLGWHSR